MSLSASRSGTSSLVVQSTLRAFTEETADTLGIPLADAFYTEWESAYVKGPDPNGTGDIRVVWRTALWRQSTDVADVYFANQLRISAFESGSVFDVWGFRWLSGLPSASHSDEDIREAASVAVEQLFGIRDPGHFHYGITPRYPNGTWSYFVVLGYPFGGGGHDTHAVLLDAQTLAFQQHNYRAISIVDRYDRGDFPTQILAAASLATLIVVPTVALVLWAGRWRQTPKP